MQLNDSERLALAQTFYKMAGALVDTKSPDSLRSTVDAEYKALYEQTGSKSFDVKLNGEVVGTYSIRFSKPKESETRLSFEVHDYIKLAKWFDTVPSNIITDYISTDLAQFAEWYFMHMGEMPDGCDIDKIITPATDKEYIGGVLKVDTEKVIDAAKGLLPASVVGLLGDGHES